MLISSYTHANGSSAPRGSIERVKDYPHFSLLLGREITSIREKNTVVECLTNHEILLGDFVIVATGFAIDGTEQKELSTIIDHIALWKDKCTITPNEKKLGEFPYLGSHFQFLEKKPETAPYLKNIHCFNYAALLSHGHLSTDIPAISVGALHLAEGITKDLFVNEASLYLQALYDFPDQEFDAKNYTFIRQ